MAFSNRYKYTLDKLIDSSDAESPVWPGPFDKESCNATRSKNSLTRLSKRDSLDDNVPDRLSRLAPKTQNSQVYQRYDIAFLSLKSVRKVKKIRTARGMKKAVEKIR